MKNLKSFWLSGACLLALAGCQTPELELVEDNLVEMESIKDLDSTVVTETSEPVPEVDDQPATESELGLIAEEEDPTLMDNMQIEWDYFADEVSEFVGTYTTHSYEYSYYELPESMQEETVTLQITAPDKWNFGSVIDWMGPFRNGGLKIGEIGKLALKEDGDSLEDNLLIDEGWWGVCSICQEESATERFESNENEIGALKIGPNYQRVVVEGLRRVDYVVDLGDYYTTLYFYLSEAAPVTVFEVLDNIVESMTIS